MVTAAIEWGPINYRVTWWDSPDQDESVRHFGDDWIAAEDFYEAKASSCEGNGRGGGVVMHTVRARISPSMGRYRKQDSP